MTGFGTHLVHFHRSDDDLVAGIATFLADGLSAGEGAVLVATAAHHAGVADALRSVGVDPSVIVFLDADDTLEQILEVGSGALDVDRLDAIAAEALALAAARASAPHVRVFGEMVALLWDFGRIPVAIELEEAWNRLGRRPTAPFTLLCGYRMPAVDEDRAQAAGFFDVCACHSAVRRGPDAPMEAWRRFDEAARALPGARAFVRGTLGSWGRHAVATEAAVVVTELATNAVLHARTPFHVSVAPAGDSVRIAVHDGSERTPVVRDPSQREARGRGLQVVRGLSSAWGVEPFAGGKTVWAELAAR